MKIYSKVNLMILGTIATPSRDGKATYYKVSVFNKETGEAGMLKCTETVGISRPISGQEYECTTLYDDTYDPASFRITDIAITEPTPGFTVPPVPETPADPKDKAAGNRK